MALVSMNACHCASLSSVFCKEETDLDIALGSDVQEWAVPLVVVDMMLELLDVDTECSRLCPAEKKGFDGNVYEDPYSRNTRDI